MYCEQLGKSWRMELHKLDKLELLKQPKLQMQYESFQYYLQMKQTKMNVFLK